MRRSVTVMCVCSCWPKSFNASCWEKVDFGCNVRNRRHGLFAITDRQRKLLKITAIVLVASPFVWIAFLHLQITIAVSRNWSEIESDKSQLPKVVLELEAKFPNSRVEYHRLRNGLDLSMTKRGYVRIDGPDVVQKFIEAASLDETERLHPMRMEFEESLHLLPAGVLVDGDVWFASPNFGTVHQEVVDLYLLRTTTDRESAIVYHYWTF